MKNFKKGFTLIELLVVVAIIGILASVVLASLNTARAKGADAAIKANLANIRAQAEIVYDETPGAYGTAANSATGCLALASGTGAWVPTAGSLFDNTTIEAAVRAAATSAGATGWCNSTIGTTSAWVASFPLKATAGTAWCVDSTGVSKQTSAIPTSGTACP
ncbi:MAG: hypothetical protein UR25_C0003G0026 [Candidatus Nomurabacteria bacterium GW2011_GWE1_32_28]|uniref:Uncharacterized protein n=1 Tax=Candidatus Nomurabacteria bacterium GW2011_GWF1_31_48 TaxID=1618767 RepID=A0A0F9YFS6_9BACT|nr:MAG: hypothetical protein UR10_C0003G0026 [Candidatus Nomurabacteria bacterium GW2011_GWF2_30_133]KKP28666.1 MAG: hypothetical protein UR18_C0002G0078 [Candidatus Nomurabacteria bacterium GW2011_GWE2_31_40]KKP30243.1 MAG: hypothetical protein UR19_C0003G0079 [Candidatus Nomurabacteria bacterium GW2011_GWF1_31_48]KKP34770.1 MAG: hypothetical protein UR25_C0003G0026 [Candidatus Nomurabacteria bacterium GW2011_GWE1_32_28]